MSDIPLIEPIQNLSRRATYEGSTLKTIEEFYSHGLKQSLTHFKDAKRHGIRTVWNRDGSVRSETQYEDGEAVE